MADKGNIKVKISDRSQVQINKIASEIFRNKKSNVQKAGRYLKKQIIKSMSVKTYSLKQLAKKDHPYARKRFPSKINVAAISPLKKYNIHERSGNLVKGVIYRTRVRKQKIGNSYSIEVFHNGNTNYADHVFLGTKFLIGRNPFKAIFSKPEVQAKIKEILEA